MRLQVVIVWLAMIGGWLLVSAGIAIQQSLQVGLIVAGVGVIFWSIVSLAVFQK